MFDLRIPAYWDHDREPDNYHHWINGITKSRLEQFTGWYAKTWLNDSAGNPLDTGISMQTLFNSVSIERTFRPRRPNEPFIYPLFHSWLICDTVDRWHDVASRPEDAIYYLRWFELSPDLIDLIARKKGKIFIFNSWEAWPPAHWQKVVELICQRYQQLSADDFIIGNQNLLCDRFMPSVSWAAFQEICKPDDALQIETKHSIETGRPRPHRFICLNRAPHAHRYHALVRLFEDRDKGLLSFLCSTDQLAWQKVSDLDSFHSDYPSIIRSQLQDPESRLSYSLKIFMEDYKGTEILDAWHSLGVLDHLPLLIHDGVDGRTNPVNDSSVGKFLDSYLHIVTETRHRYDPSEMFMSEKIFKPVKHMQPFVMLGNAGTLREFRRLGYESFGKWIDETYDDITDDYQRIEAALASAKSFYNQSQETLTEVMREMLPVFEHNYTTLKNNIANLQINVVMGLMWHMVGTDRTIPHEEEVSTVWQKS